MSILMPGRSGQLMSRRKVLGQGITLAAGAAMLPLLGSTARAQGGPLQFWQFYGPGGENQVQSKFFEDMVAAWNAANSQQIELVYMPAGDYMNGTQLQTAFASGQGPDLFIVSPGDFLRYYNGGALLDLSPYITPEAAADFPADVIANRMVDGKFYGVPMEVGPMAMFYSIKAFEEAGLNENDIPKTWDELREVGKKLTTADRYGVLFDTQPGYYQNFTWYPFMWQGGSDFQDASGKSALNTPGTVQALRFWQQCIEEGIAPRQVLGGGGSDIISNLAAGYCAIQNIGIWGVSELDTLAPDFEYGVFRLPTPAGGKYVNVGGGWAFVANAKSRNPEAAGAFCAWALASMEQDSVDRVTYWCTEAQPNMPPRTSALAAGGDKFQQGMLGVFSREVYPGTRAEPRVPPEAYKIVSDAIQATQLGGADPATEAAKADELLNAFLASYTGAPIL